MVDLKVNIGNLELKNPVMSASGTFGYGSEFTDFIDISRLGGIIVKGTTIHAREGNPYPRMAETPSGMLNAVGLQNRGVDYFINKIYPSIADINTNIIINVSGSSIEEYIAAAEKINELDQIETMKAETVRVLKLFKKTWTPASKEGKTVRCLFNYPINFNIE